MYINFRESALNIEFLKSVNITHVLNAAEGKKPGCVDTSEVDDIFSKMYFQKINFQEYYNIHKIKYLGLKMFDVPQTNITKHFDVSTQYIGDAVSSGGKP